MNDLKVGDDIWLVYPETCQIIKGKISKIVTDCDNFIGIDFLYCVILNETSPYDYDVFYYRGNSPFITVFDTFDEARDYVYNLIHEKVIELEIKKSKIFSLSFNFTSDITEDEYFNTQSQLNNV